MKFKFFLDEVYFSFETNELILKGWCFSNKEDNCPSISIKINDVIVKEFSPEEPRPDVIKCYPESPWAHKCGFYQAVSLCEINSTVKVIVDIGGKEKLVYKKNLDDIEKRGNIPFAFCIDQSYINISNGRKTVVIEGWCFNRFIDKETFIKVKKPGKGAVTRKCYNERPDVAANYTYYFQALHSGFGLEIEKVKGNEVIEIFAFTDDLPAHLLTTIDLSSLPRKGEPEIKSGKLLYKYVSLSYAFIKAFMFLLRKGYKITKHKHGFRMSPNTAKLYWYKGKSYITRRLLEAKANSQIPFNLPEKLEPYQVWVRHNTLSDYLISNLIDAQKSFGYRPVVSIVMPVWNVDICWLRRAIDSVQKQIYDNWELCIADDSSTLPAIKPFLEDISKRDCRIKVLFREKNGNISLATNSAVEMASGEFLLLMDNDDELAPNTLFEIVRLLQDHPEADVIYSDDDKIDENGKRYAPQFKPDWSPELLLSYMYFSHFLCLRKSLFTKVGGCRSGLEGTQDYDLALRITDMTDKVFHIPKVLYHWRALSGSTAVSGEAKPEAFARGVKAVQETLQRRNLMAKVYRPDFAVAGGLGIFSLDWPDEGPKVTIIIPTKNQFPVLKRCLESLAKTTYKNFDVFIIDNMSYETQTLEYLASLPWRVERIPNPSEAFSFAFINNEAAQRVDSDLVLFLNNDTEVINPKWLSQMVGYKSIKGVGAVGARLLFPDNRVQHAGVVKGFYKGMAGPAFRLLPEWDPGYLAYARVARNYSAMTAACLLVDRQEFLELGGFDEENFAVAYNDVDFCLRLTEIDKRLVYVPEALLKHHEGVSRGFSDDPREIATFRNKYKDYSDPYYNPNLSLENECFEISTGSTLNYGKFTKKRPKLLMVGFNLNLEGAPFSQYEITCGLLNRGNIDIEVYCPSDGPLRKYYEEKGVKVHIFEHPLLNVYEMGQYNPAMDKFGQWLKASDFDVIYGNTLQTFYVIEAANMAGIPCLWNIRESEPFSTYFNFLPPKISHRGIECFNFPYKTIFVAEATRQLFELLDNRKTFTVIHNGLQKSRINEYCTRVSKEEAKKITGVPEDQHMILIVGTVCPRKGQRDFTEAAIEIIKQGRRDVCFYIVGGRPSEYLSDIKRLISDANMTDNIKIIMETDKTYNYYRAADIFVCSSCNESYPRIILEAMAFGLPIVTTPVFGIREQVQENINALIYEPGDINKLGEQLIRLLDDNNLRGTFARNSVDVLNCITSYDEMVEQYEKHVLDAWMTKGSK